jgi:lipoprotein-anchoring transpeptidase ErfK/SrfK
MMTERTGIRQWILGLMLLTAGGIFALAHAQAPNQPRNIPNPDQPPLKLDTEMDEGTGARREAFIKRPVYYRSREAPGTIIVDTSERFLYLIKGNDVAIRYGIGVGRDGFQWAGLLRIARKAEWPDWTPPDEMISGSHICRAGWPAAPATRWERAPCISARPCTASTAPISRRRSATPYRRAASAWSTMTWSTSTTKSRSARR